MAACHVVQWNMVTGDNVCTPYLDRPILQDIPRWLSA